MPRHDLSEIIVILDRSGSMESTKRDMEGGFDAFIAQQIQLPGHCKVTLVKFDDVVEAVYEGLALAQVPPLELEPRGATALYDGIGFSIDAVSTRLARTPEHARPERVLVVIVTDGGENASKTYNRDQVFTRIRYKREVDGWEFAYLGANQDAFAVGRAMGIDHAYAYTSSPAGTRAVMTGIATSVGDYRSGRGYTTPMGCEPSEPKKGNDGTGGGSKLN